MSDDIIKENAASADETERAPEILTDAEKAADAPADEAVNAVDEAQETLREISLISTDPGEEELMAQIDAFRHKAQELSSLIRQKQNKVRDLEDLVMMREKQNDALKEELEESRTRALEISTQLNEKVGILSKGLSEDFADLSDTLGDCIQKNFSDIREGIVSGVSAATDPVLEKFGCIDENVNGAVSGLSGSVSEMKESVSGLKEQIFDKVHTESVQSYKNLQEFIKENDRSAENMQSIISASAGLNDRTNKRVTLLTILSLVNIGGLVVVLLKLFNIF